MTAPSCPACADHECDLLVIGAGPAGLAAAINGASEGLNVIVLERGHELGGQASSSSRIENYLGFGSGVSGPELTAAAVAQAQRFGASLHVNSEVIDLRPSLAGHTAMCASGVTYECRTALVTSGVTYRRLAVPGADDLLGRGIFYGASPEQAYEYEGKRVFVVGGANSAGQAAIHLAQHGAITSIISRSPLEKGMSTYLHDRILDRGDILVHEAARIAAVRGTKKNGLSHVTVADPAAVATHEAAAVFVFIGAEPRLDWAPGIALDNRGFILTGQEAVGVTPVGFVPPQYLETSVPGVFAAGDVRSGSVKRVAAAAGEGAMAVQFIHKHLSRQPKEAINA